MKLAIQAESAKEATAVFGLLMSHDSPFVLRDFTCEDEPGQLFYAEMTVHVDDAEDAWMLQRAGLGWLAAERAKFNQMANLDKLVNGSEDVRT